MTPNGHCNDPVMVLLGRGTRSEESDERKEGTLLMKRLLMGLLMVALALSVFAGAALAKTPVIGVSLMTLNSPFFVAMERGMKEAAAQAGARLVVTDAQLDLARQISAVENLIAQKVDVLLLNAVDSTAIGPAVIAANDAGIPVITVDVAALAGKTEAHVASDNVEAGRIAGKYVAERLGGKGMVAILDGPPITSFMERTQGFKEAIGRYPGIKLVRERRVVENSIQKFLEAADNLLTAEPNLDAIFAVNDFGALAVRDVVLSSSRNYKVFSIGVDGMADATAAIAKGDVVAATVAQQPALMGRLAVKAGLDLLGGKSLPQVITVPLQLVTKDNAAGFSW